MKLPVTWINESFKKDYSADDLSDLLTLSGIESEIEKNKGEGNSRHLIDSQSS